LLKLLWLCFLGIYSGRMPSTMRVLVKGQKGLFYEYNANHGTKEKFEKGSMRGGISRVGVRK
jgi:hypothetical protein